MSTNINIEIGKRIFNARKNLKISRAELGNKVNLHESTVKRYEDGKIKSLDIEKMKEFANALEVDVIDLLGWDVEGLSNIKSHVINYKSNSSSGINLDKFINNICGIEESYSILKLFDKLNNQGKKEALKRVEELTFVPKYQNNTIETIAAHNDCLNEDGEIDKIKDDIEDMKNW